jgi:hypothetical protein
MPINLKGVASVPPGEPKEEKAQRTDQDRLKKVCADFESIFIRQP